MTQFCSFYDWVISHFIYISHLLYPSLPWWMFRLLPCPGYCKQCCNELWGTCVFFTFGFLRVYAWKWDCWVLMVVLFLVFFKGSPSSIVAVSVYIPTNSARAFIFVYTLSTFIVGWLFDDGHSDWCEVISRCSFDLHFSNNVPCWASFQVFVNHLYVIFGEMSV